MQKVKHHGDKKRRYGYEGPSRRRRLRRLFRLLRTTLGLSTAIIGGAFLFQAVNFMPTGTPFSRTVLWIAADLVAVAVVVLLVSMVGWWLEWHVATHPPARDEDPAHGHRPPPHGKT